MIARIASLAILAAASMTLAQQSVAAPLNFDIRVGPPASRYEAVPAARPGYVWAPGYWDWRGNRHVWTQGHWVQERRGYVYTQPTWVNHGGRYHLYRGAWARGGGDRDRDGVPNRFDRDRDGDGVRNRNDRHPDNPRRR
ncbi:MAG: YXWGXW repeat-containing protein [Caldimonas sp.]